MITLSIVSHGQRDIALHLLQDLARLQPAHVTEIIYTANIHEPDLPAIEFGHIRLLIIRNERPKGFGSNHNAAFYRCQSPYFCVMNPDLRLADDPFSPLIDGFAQKRRGLMAPRIYSPEGRLENTARKLYTVPELLKQKLSPQNHGTQPDWIAGMFLLFKSRAYHEIGGFDEGYFLYIEDVDICTRLCLAGWTLAQTEKACVIHEARKQSHRSLRFTLWHIAGMLRYWSSLGFWRYRARLKKEERRG
ncbi:MAG: glycosyltransferase family 2 protein [Lautropia sp.]|nr:glycosyltransferase family 2 protein [Lautropia sp.]